MNGQLSVGEWICQDFERYLKSLKTEGQCVFLPFEIQSLHLRNIGKFVEKHLDFDSVNVIHGNNGSGKSTIKQTISSVIGSQSMVKSGQREGEINMSLSDGSSLHQNVFDVENIRCIVLDDAGERLDQERYGQFLRYLRGLNVQLIITKNSIDDDLNSLFTRIFPDCNFIQLN